MEIYMSAKKRVSPLKVILTAICSLVLLVIVVFISLMYIFPLFEYGPRGKVEGTNNWMKDLNDEMLISEVVLPGSHDTAAIKSDLSYFTKCQSLNVKEQLNSGFRYLDIRLDLTEDDQIMLMHGWCHCRVHNFPLSSLLYLDKILKDCYEFLDENPTECIVFTVKSENSKTDVAKLQILLDNLIKTNEKYWLLTDKLPKVGELRGKMLLLRRYSNKAELENPGIMFDWNDQNATDDLTKHIESNSYNPDFTLFIQDRYKYNSEEKWNAFVNSINYMPEGNDYVKVSFLSTNGSITYGHPYKYANALNKKLLDSDIELNGWVIVDFCSPKLAERIYRYNFE